MRGDGGVAGKGRVVGVQNFHSWDTCTMPLTNINSDWRSSGLCIILAYIIYAVPLIRIWDVILRRFFNSHFGVQQKLFTWFL